MFDQLTAADIMRKALISARPDQLLTEVERMLVDHHISGMPVIANNKLAGVISRSDVARAQVLSEALDGQVADELNWDETQADGFRHRQPDEFRGFSQRFGKLRVRDMMRTQVVTCNPATPAPDVAELMLRHHIHRIIVVEEELPVGLVSSLDIVAIVARQAKQAQRRA